tara:strand:+ start:1369 stop:1686 length:318 start_codon:yes stop_codon:yes gene_type:complete
MAVTWTILALERNTDDGVVVAHWQASDSETVGTGDDTVIYSGRNYGTVAFNPDPDADGYTAYSDITEAQAIGWVKADVDADAVEAGIAAQIADSKAPAITAGVPW